MKKKGRVHQLASQISASEHTIELKKTQIDQSEIDIRAATEDVTHLHKEIADQVAQTEQQRSQLGTLSEEIDSKNKNLAEHTRTLEEERNTLTKLTDKVKSGETQIFELLKKQKPC